MTICCKGDLVDLSRPRVMGVLNSTPDSFFDGGKYWDPYLGLKQVEVMLKDGADFIDVGGYSSRPGAADVSQTEELKRVIPMVEGILEEFPQTLISVDTFRAIVAEKALDAGAAIVNDISAGLRDSEMLPLIAKRQVPYVMMHMKGTPQTMTDHTDYENLIPDILYYFSERLSAARELGITDCIADPGFGFAKTREQNFELLRGLNAFKTLDAPILVGISRKSMIHKTLGITPKEALNGTTALHMVALQEGANILRVHDVKEAKECIDLWGALQGNS
ncbi:dihydropteroate synthase [Robiginitalea aurantiaca]|uniref:Dihydropteroate synthase n=1 Tax=Robiginitalea aurantiaca TaxID=3056915 RepID=A0ABT7WDD8_9FLAO|nr:dihydropteroate synthase [Robiginitalea aurantiaca]MDM9630933.1 dihydropteroate synthase [Robiginitalea aurantiaca]